MRRKAKSHLLATDALHGQDNDSRAETLAQYLGKLKRVARATLAIPSDLPKLHDFNVNCGHITFEELCEASTSMKRNKQCGADCVYAEFLHAICLPCSDASEWILTLF